MRDAVPFSVPNALSRIVATSVSEFVAKAVIKTVSVCVPGIVTGQRDRTRLCSDVLSKLVAKAVSKGMTGSHWPPDGCLCPKSGTAFGEAVGPFSCLSCSRGSILGTVGARKSRISTQIAQEITTIRVNGTSNPVKTELGFHIIHVLDKQPKGSIRGIEEVRDDIVNVLSTKTQNAAIEQMLSGLRSKMAVEVHLDLVPNIQKNANDSPAAHKQHADSADIN